MSFSAAASRPAVLADLWAGSRLRSTALVVLGAAMTGLAAQVSIPLPHTPVPLTLQTLAVLLSGTALGPVRGAASMVLYVGLGLAGVPWLAGHSSGFHPATMGYLIGFVLAAGACGALASRSADRRFLGALGSMLVGNVIIYACGVAVLAAAISVDLPTAIRLGVVPFLVGDLLKMLVAAGLLPSVWHFTRGA